MIFLPLAVGVYWSGHLQQWLLPALQPYIPPQLQAFLPITKDVSSATNGNIDLLPEDLLKICDKHQYTSEIISLDPLVIYINNFTSTQEAEELINIGYYTSSHEPTLKKPNTNRL